MTMEKIILGASLGNCVHVGGVAHFLQLAEREGYTPIYLGPAIPVDDLLREIELHHPAMMAVGYRLTPDNARPLIAELVQKVRERGIETVWSFGGTGPVARVAEEFDFFDYISDGSDDIDDSLYFLRNGKKATKDEVLPDDLVARIGAKYPYPLLRHHYGEPSVEKTVAGIREIAESRVLDVISVGPDQNTQQFYFHPEKRKPEYEGAGGVPLRTREEFEALKAATKFGNQPLIRCYSGTADVFDMAQLLKDTLNNAWCAVPLCWYNKLDGRGDRDIDTSVKEAVELMRWHAERGIPVEANEPHHWGLRDAHDVIPVVMAYLSARNAKKSGVRHYVSQYMFNVPNSLSFPMDLARVLAMIELTESLQDDTFTLYRETRAGLPFLSADLDVAKGQLAATTYMQMAVHPHIIHVVGFCEAEHIASPKDVIESCKIVRGVIKTCLEDQIDLVHDPRVQTRKEHLLKEARFLLSFIERFYSNYQDPLCEPAVIADCIKRGFIDAPHIVKGGEFTGDLFTTIIGGRCVAYDRKAGRELTERERLAHLCEKEGIPIEGLLDPAPLHA